MRLNLAVSPKYKQIPIQILLTYLNKRVNIGIMNKQPNLIMATKWELVGQVLVEQLQGVTNEATIKELAQNIVTEARKTYTNKDTLRRSLGEVRKAVVTAFPDTKKQQHDYQYFTDSGKGKNPRYEHLAIKYLTLSKEEWDELREESKQKYSDKSTEDKPQVNPKITLQDMNIETLELDADTQAIVKNALEHSGISLAEFIQKACTVYATTLVGKFKQFDSDLSSVSTSELLTAKYKTHPGRAREMVIRAIQAIKIFNGNEPEPTNRWMITQTAIQSLTGSKPATVKEILPDYQTDIDDYNTSCNFSSPYINRKPGKRIEDVINVAELVPEGV